MNEFDVIATFFNCEQTIGRDLLVPNGDDCAVIATHNQMPLAISVDTCTEGVHFPKNSAPKWVAKRALRTALSDLAAMGATPKWATMALTLPQIDTAWLSAFSKSLHKDLVHFGCVLIGGDTTQGNDLSISFTVMGECPRPITRSGAQEGDSIYVTNTVGNGAAALYFLQHQLDAHLYSGDDKSILKSREKYAKHHFYKPELTFTLSQAIVPIATSAIDISDGLLADLAHICDKSHVTAELNLNALPFSAQACKLAKQKADNALLGFSAWLEDDISDTKKTLFTWALSGGDDYQLCFTAPKGAVQSLDAAIQNNLTEIGAIEPASNKPVRLLLNNQPLAMTRAGFAHFSK